MAKATAKAKVVTTKAMATMPITRTTSTTTPMGRIVVANKAMATMTNRAYRGDVC